MALSLTETLIQGGIIKHLEMPKYFYQMLFKAQFFSKTDTIVYDEVYEDNRAMARFVAPNVVSATNQNKPFQAKAFRPAYLKEKHVIHPYDPVLQARAAGEAIGGTLSIEQREQLIRAKIIRDQAIMIENRIEWMCFQALAAGRMRIQSTMYPDTTVDYGRNNDLQLTTAGAGLSWANANNNPLLLVKEISDRVYDRGRGEVNTLIVGRTAAQNFRRWFEHKDRAFLLDNNFRGSDLKTNIMNAGEVRGVGLIGTFTASNGTRIEVWSDNRAYQDADGSYKRYIGDNEVIGFDSNALMGVQAFGAIKNGQAQYQPMRVFHSEYTSLEPRDTYLLSESAPLPIVLNPDVTCRVLNANS